MKKKKEGYKTLLTLAAIVLIIIIISSATFAYWRWETASGQQTNVSVQVQGGTLVIDGTNVTNTGVTLYPVKLANCASNALVGTATVKATNETETNMTVTLKLKGTLTAAQGTLNATACGSDANDDGNSDGNKDCLKWAVVETNSSFSSTTTCANATYKGTFASVGTNTPIETGITWTADGTSTGGTGKTTTKYYKVYVWLDSAYSYTNKGTSVSDPMQNLKVTMTWSEDSTMKQLSTS